MTKNSILTTEYLDKALERMSVVTAKNLDKELEKMSVVAAKNLDKALEKLSITTAKNLDTALNKQSKETAKNLEGALGKFEKSIDSRFDEVVSILVRHDVTLDRHEGILTALVTQVQNIDERLVEVGNRVGKVETAVLDLGEELALRNKAADADSETLIHHEERIEKLELRFA